MALHINDTVDANKNKITNLATPTTAETTAAATVQFVLDNAGGSPTATNVSFTPEANTFPAETDNVDEALKHLFTYANSGKDNVADSIGYETPYSGTFATLAGHIDTTKTKLQSFLPNAEQTVESTDKIDTLANKLDNVRVFKQIVKLRQSSVYSLNLNSPITENKMCVMVYQLVNDGSTEEFSASFNNGESGNFNYDSNNVMFDGAMKLKTTTASVTQSDSVGNIYTFTFDVSGVSDFRINTVTSTASSITVTTETLPFPQAVWAKGSIDISDVSSIESIALTDTENGAGKFRLAVSVDGGTEFKAWNGTSWATVFNSTTPTNVATFGTSGMTETTAEALTYVQFEQLIGSSTDIRFAYYLEQPKFSDAVNIEAITLNGRATGTFKPVGSSTSGTIKPIFEYVNSQLVRVYFGDPAVNDTYRINYIDTP